MNQLISRIKSWSNIRWMVLIFLAALAIRSAYVLAAPRFDPFLKAENGLWGDARFYHMIAVNLAEGNGYTLDPGITKDINIYPPLLPHFLAGVYLIFGPSVVAARLAQAVLGSLTAVILYLLGTRMFTSRAVGLLTALGAIFHPLLLVFAAWLYTETIYIFLLSVALLLFFYLLKNPRMILAVGAGFIIGLSMLARPMLSAFAPFLLLWALLSIKNKWRAVGISAVVVLAMFMTMLTWTLRNYWVSGEWALVRSYPAYYIWKQNNPLANGGVGTSKEFDQAAYDLLASQYVGFERLSEDEQNSKALEATVRWVWSDPLGYASLLGKKVLRFWSPLALTISDNSRDVPIPGWVATAVAIPYDAFILVAVVGMVVAFKRRIPVLMAVILVVYFQLVTLLFSASTRYAMPIIPSMLLLAAFGLIVIFQKIFPALRKL